MNKQIFMLFDGRVHIINIPNNQNDPYRYARYLLSVPDKDITPWGEVVFNDIGIATFQFNFKYNT